MSKHAFPRLLLLALAAALLGGCLDPSDPTVKSKAQIQSGMRFDEVLKVAGDPTRFSLGIVGRVPGGPVGTLALAYSNPVPWNREQFGKMMLSGEAGRGFIWEYRLPKQRPFLVYFDIGAQVTKIEIIK